MSLQSEVILQIIAEVDRIDAHDHAKHSLKRFINETCLAAGITVVDRSERVRFARRLLDEGEPRPVIRNRLMTRFGIRKTAAYRAIDIALKLSANERFLRKVGAQNSLTGTTHKQEKNEYPISN